MPAGTRERRLHIKEQTVGSSLCDRPRLMTTGMAVLYNRTSRETSDHHSSMYIFQHLHNAES